MNQHVKTYFSNLALGLTKLTMTVAAIIIFLMAISGALPLPLPWFLH